MEASVASRKIYHLSKLRHRASKEEGLPRWKRFLLIRASAFLLTTFLFPKPDPRLSSNSRHGFPHGFKEPIFHPRKFGFRFLDDFSFGRLSQLPTFAPPQRSCKAPNFIVPANSKYPVGNFPFREQKRFPLDSRGLAYRLDSTPGFFLREFLRFSKFAFCAHPPTISKEVIDNPYRRAGH